MWPIQTFSLQTEEKTQRILHSAHIYPYVYLIIPLLSYRHLLRFPECCYQATKLTPKNRFLLSFFFFLPGKLYPGCTLRQTVPRSETQVKPRILYAHVRTTD